MKSLKLILAWVEARAVSRLMRKYLVGPGLYAGVFLIGLAAGALLMKSFVDRIGGLPLTLEPTAVPESTQGKLALFVMAGQSNISGRGRVTRGAANPFGEHVFVFANDYRWRKASVPVDAPDGQVDFISLDPKPGLGPGPTVAAEWLKANPGRSLGLIPCARGSSVIAQWQPSLSEDSLYGSCLKRIRAASLMGKVEGVLFFQGEWDALKPEAMQGVFRGTVDHTKWARRFTGYVRGMRRDLGKPRLPVVFAQLGDHGDPAKYVNWSKIQAIQAGIRLPKVAMIQTAGLPLRDKVHFNAESQREIGRRFARAYLRLRGRPVSP